MTRDPKDSPRPAGGPRVGDEPDVEPELKAEFGSRREVTRVVRRLMQAGVPTDRIRVGVLDSSGNTARELSVDSGDGVFRGALLGAGLGAAVGLLIVAAAFAGLFGDVTTPFLSVRSLGGAVQTVALAAGAAVPLGALIGLGRWRASATISADEAEHGVVVSVRTTTARESAEAIFSETGSDRAR